MADHNTEDADAGGPEIDGSNRYRHGKAQANQTVADMVLSALERAATHRES